MLKHAVPIVALLLLAACTPDDTVDATPIESVTSSSSASIEQSSSHSSVDPVSFPALMQKELRGSDLVLGDVLARTDAYVRHTITYKSGDLTISGIMNIPHGDGPFPLLILNHGYIDPAVYTNGRGLKREQDYLARRGYAVLHTDYRGHAFSDDDPTREERLRLGYIEDSMNAVHAVRASNLPQLDSERVGMLGHSMGGGVTLGSLVVDPTLVDAAVLFAPVSSDAWQNFERWTRSRPEVAAKILENHGSRDENPTFWDNVSAKTFFDRIEAPIMNHHGTLDKDVPIEWSEDLQRYLEEANKDATLHIYDGEPHEFIKAWPLVMQRTVDFFDSHLKP